MPTSSFYKFQDFMEQLAKKEHNLDTDVFKAYLSNEAPQATDTVKTDIADLTTDGGYTAGGEDCQLAVSETAGQVTVTAVDITWTATTGFGPFRYAVIYNFTNASNYLVCYFDYGVGGVSVGAGEQFVLDFGASLFTLGA